jgi:hypothetical protein
MDGRLIKEIIKPGLLHQRQQRFEERPITYRDDLLPEWDAAVEDEVKDRLKKLGYLG